MRYFKLLLISFKDVEIQIRTKDIKTNKLKKC